MYFCSRSSSMPPKRRTSRPSTPCWRISSQVRCTTRAIPVVPMNMWCASSRSMNCTVRDSGSKALSAREASWYLPSRSVKKVNMKNDSQSGVGRAAAPHRPQVPALLHVHLEEVAQVVDARAGVAEVALLLDRRWLGVALHHHQPAQRVAELAGDLLPDRLAL